MYCVAPGRWPEACGFESGFFHPMLIVLPLFVKVIIIKKNLLIITDVIAVGDNKENFDVKQGRFVCKFCRTHFYHATALVASSL